MSFTGKTILKTPSSGIYNKIASAGILKKSSGESGPSPTAGANYIFQDDNNYIFQDDSNYIFN